MTNGSYSKEYPSCAATEIRKYSRTTDTRFSGTFETVYLKVGYEKSIRAPCIPVKIL